MSGIAVETARATRREWTGLLVIALPCLLYSMDLTVLNWPCRGSARTSGRPAPSSCGS